MTATPKSRRTCLGTCLHFGHVVTKLLTVTFIAIVATSLTMFVGILILEAING